MRELTFDGLSPDGARLVLAGKDGQKYTVVIDERMEAAVRRDRARIGQVEIEQAGVLRPREIQARIRAGATAEDVAAASGLPIEHIRRFEGPVLTERAWVAQQAQATEVRRPGGDIELGDLVAERLHSQGVDPADIAWDAWRRDDGMWVVIATFPIPPNMHVATWTYDSGSRTMTVADDNARSLSAITVEQPLRLAVARPALASVAPLDDDDERPDLDEASAVAILGPRMIRTIAPEPDLEEPDDLEEPEDLEDPDDLEEPEEIGDELAPADLAVDIEGLPDPESPPVDPEDGADDEPGDFPVDEGLEPQDELAEDELAEDETDEASDTLTTGPTTDAEDVPLFEAPAPGAHKPSGKPSVPSFDDILFGPGPTK
jgi:hypothetical protein